MILLFLANLARADIIDPNAPPCEASMCPKGADAQTCSANHDEPNACADQWGAQGYAQLCRKGGATVWTEVWCKGGDPSAPTPKQHGCMGCNSGSASVGLGIGLLGVVGLFRRSRAT
jgi:uncharacterized protein (TIGR03382 family)